MASKKEKVLLELIIFTLETDDPLPPELNAKLIDVGITPQEFEDAISSYRRHQSE